MIGELPSPFDSVMTLARITLLRLTRGKALYICVLIAALPVFYAAVMHAFRSTTGPDAIMGFEMLGLALLPPVFVAASIGEEIEERTSTYLWSRPIPRWAVMVGKLVALVPIAIVLILGSWFAAVKIGAETTPSLRSFVALGAGTIAISLVSGGIAAMLPKHGMAFAVIYLIVDATVGIMPFSLADLSLTHQVRVLADVYHLEPAMKTPIIAMVVVSAIWTTLGFWRIRRLEV